VTITGNLTVNGSTTTSSSQNTGYGDSLVDLHYTNNGVNTSDDGKDIGLIFNYYKTTDKNAYLIWSNATQAMEYYSTATDNGTIISGTLGNYKGAGFIYAGSTSGTTTLQATATAGTTTLTLPAATDTLVGRATTDTLTNKSIDLTNNTLTATSAQLRTAVTDETGSGVLVFGTAPTFTTTIDGGSTFGAFGSVTTLTEGYTGTGASSTHNIATAALTGAYTKIVNIGTGGTTGSTTQVNISSSVTGQTLIRGGLAVGNTTSTTDGEIRATAGITSFYSDDRLKTKTGNIQNALEKVLSLDGFHYHANETAVALGYDASKQEVGLSAQQVQAVLPEVIAPAPIDPQYMTLQYERLVPLLVEAIKEQQKQIEELKAKLGN
jgi:hypothetical protein